MNEMTLHERAVLHYKKLCDALDGRNWKCDKNDSSLMILTTAKSNHLIIYMPLMIDEPKQCIELRSVLPFPVNKDKRIDMAIAVNALNASMKDGCFRFRMSNGELSFLMSQSYADSVLSDAFVDYMLSKACFYIEKYNCDLYELGQGRKTLEQFLGLDEGTAEE